SLRRNETHAAAGAGAPPADVAPDRACRAARDCPVAVDAGWNTPAVVKSACGAGRRTGRTVAASGDHPARHAAVGFGVTGRRAQPVRLRPARVGAVRSRDVVLDHAAAVGAARAATAAGAPGAPGHSAAVDGHDSDRTRGTDARDAEGFGHQCLVPGA